MSMVHPRALLVVGTRPEAIKLAPVYHALKAEGWGVPVWVTGQHPIMAPAALEEMAVPIMAVSPPVNGGSLRRDFHLLVRRTRFILDWLKPQCTLVQGDTSSACAAAMAVRDAQMTLAHVEAGLRTNSLYDPWPEEAYRRQISRWANLHFTPSEREVQHLRAEGISPETIIVTGNTGIDAFLRQQKNLAHDPAAMTQLIDRYSALLRQKPFLLVTLHRRDWADGDLAAMVRRLGTLPSEYGLAVCLIVHPSLAARVPAALAAIRSMPKMFTTPPLSHRDMVFLMTQCFAIVTDSGGIQEEAPVLGKPLLVCRQGTERRAALSDPGFQVIGHCPDRMVDRLGALLQDTDLSIRLCRRVIPYGTGGAAACISRVLSDHWASRPDTRPEG